jgi:hypothetical protein
MCLCPYLLQLTVTLPSNDPLYKSKRDVLQSKGLSTMQTFDLKRSAPLPPLLLPYMRLAHTTDAAQLQQVGVLVEGGGVEAAGCGKGGQGVEGQGLVAEGLCCGRRNRGMWWLCSISRGQLTPSPLSLYC